MEIISIQHPHLVYPGESCPGKITGFIFVGPDLSDHSNPGTLTFLARIYILIRAKLAGTHVLVPKVSKRDFVLLW
jgi:hypothetical protein